jgi:hypothetical protein
MELPPAEFSPRRLLADDLLIDLGYRWVASTQRWVPPAPTPPADPNVWPDSMAQDLLRTLGWSWTGAKWENRKPAPSVLDMPLGVSVVIGRGSSSAMRFGPDTPVRALVEHAEAMHNKLARVGAE